MHEITGRIILRKREEERLLAGHQWIFSNEIGEIQGGPASGDTVELLTADGRFLGTGFYNPGSLIAFRLLSRSLTDLGPAFWRDRILAALEYRRALYPALNSFRAVFGESDNLPGLIVDKYDRWLAVQMLSAGMERNREDILTALNGVFSPAGVIARNDSALRALEGLEAKTEVLSGEVPERLEIEENGIRFLVNLRGGQKTGFFFDQRDNRLEFSRYCRGKRVLDCFCHTGAFSLYAVRAGAAGVTGVDSSGPALQMARENAALNHAVEQFSSHEADVPAFLEELEQKKEKFDIINLDPPGLIKSRKHFPAGYRLYLKLNSAALALLPSGGILATSSCSHHLSPADFREMLRKAAAKTRRQVRLLEIRSQAKDHPVLLSMPETEYLKFALLQVL